MLKRIFKYLKKFFLGLSGLIILYFLFALILSVASTNPDDLECYKDKEVYINTNGIHLEVIIPKAYLGDKIKESIYIHPEVEYVSFSWGDKIFYLETPTWDELKFSTAIKALLLKSETAIHVSNYSRKYSTWKKKDICTLQMDLIMDYIYDSFERDHKGRLMEIPDSGYTDYDTFYEATGSYNCFQTCNEWVNKCLKEGMIKTSIWSPFDHGVLYQFSRTPKSSDDREI